MKKLIIAALLLCTPLIEAKKPIWQAFVKNVGTKAITFKSAIPEKTKRKKKQKYGTQARHPRWAGKYENVTIEPGKTATIKIVGTPLTIGGIRPLCSTSGQCVKVKTNNVQIKDHTDPQKFKARYKKQSGGWLNPWTKWIDSSPKK